MIQAPNLQNVPVIPIMPNGQQQDNQSIIPPQQPTGQYPRAIYNYPVGSSYMPIAQKAKSQFNGVNIEIVNPQGQGTAGGYGIPQQNALTQNSDGQFNGVNLEIVNPQGQGVSAGYGQNVMPAQYYPVSPYMNQPFIQNQPLPQAPIIQQPPYIDVTPLPASQPTQTDVPQLPAPQPVIQNNTPVVEPAMQQVPNINPESFAGRLRTDDLDAQKATIEEMAQILSKPDVNEIRQQGENQGKTQEEIGGEIDNAMKKWRLESSVLLDDQIFDGLIDIVNKDISSLAAPTPEVIELRQKNPNELTEQEKQLIQATPKEKAELNKKFALYTISFMLEALNDRVEQKKNTVVPLNELPCIDAILDAVKGKGNESPQVQIAAISALSHINRPEYTDDLKTMLEIVQNDENEEVRNAAATALEKLSPNNSTEQNTAA